MINRWDSAEFCPANSKANTVGEKAPPLAPNVILSPNSLSLNTENIVFAMRPGYPFGHFFSPFCLFQVLSPQTSSAKKL
jgi:hypothetical protein